MNPALLSGYGMRFVRGYGLLLLLALPLSASLSTSTVWDTTEAYYVQTPREMAERGDWIVPYFNGQPRLNKPPLAYWILLPVYRVLSPSLVWERLLLAGLAFGCILAVFFCGRLLEGRGAGLLAAGILATTFRFLIVARRLLIDLLLLFLILWAVVCFLSWLRSGRPAAFLGAWMFLGLGFLTKGPVALLPLLFLGGYLWMEKGRRGRGAPPWVKGGLLFVGISSSWFLLLAYRMGWEPVLRFFLTENLSRFAGGDFGPGRGAFYYLGVFFGDFFPWSLLFPAAVLWALKERERIRSTRLLGLWFFSVLVIFSLSSNKQEYYLLPAYPAAALWLALYLRSVRPPLWLRGAAALLTALGGLSLVGAAHLLLNGSGLWVPALLVPVGCFGLLTGRYRLAAAGLALFYWAGFAVYLGPWEAYKPVYPLARRIQSLEAADPGRPLRAGYYDFAAPSLVYYLNRPILEIGEEDRAVAALDSDEWVALLVNESDYRRLEARTRRPLSIVEARPKLYTTPRILIQGLRRGRSDTLRESWTRSIYLITNREGI